MYGRGAASIAEQVGKSVKEAQDIIDQFYQGFPKVKEWVDATQKSCHEKGYVETLWGRRRRLPDIQLPRYEVKLKDKSIQDRFNPLLGVHSEISEEDLPVIIKYKKLTDKNPNRVEYEKIKADAEKEGVEISNNTGFIAQAERQAVNARVQGGSADITKRAMIAVFNDPLMKELGFRLLLCIHDELIGEVPEENAERASQRLSELMLAAPYPECQLPFKCDADVFSHWYSQEYSTRVRADFNDLIKKGTERETAIREIYRMHRESTEEYLNNILNIEEK